MILCLLCLSQKLSEISIFQHSLHSSLSVTVCIRNKAKASIRSILFIIECYWPPPYCSHFMLMIRICFHIEPGSHSTVCPIQGILAYRSCSDGLLNWLGRLWIWESIASPESQACITMAMLKKRAGMSSSSVLRSGLKEPLNIEIG